MVIKTCNDQVDNTKCKSRDTIPCIFNSDNCCIYCVLNTHCGGICGQAKGYIGEQKRLNKIDILRESKFY